MDKRLTMLMILDGFGINEKEQGNAVKLAKTPNIDKLMKTCKTTVMNASGLAVGLPEGQMGNSEVGHTNIGAGRIVYQELTKITKSIEDGDFFSIPEFNKAIENCKKYNSKLHIMGLLSDGGVHSHIRHLFGLLEFAKRKDFENVYVHCFMDGRDTPPASGETYIAQLEEKMKEKGIGKIATVSGRFYSMDRDKRWQRIQKSYEALVNGKGLTATSAMQAVEASYQKEVFDEFIEPTVICNGTEPVATIGKHDSVIFFNFRPDRAREITRAINDKVFDGFKRETLNLVFVTMTQYDKTLEGVEVAYSPQTITNTLGEYVASKGLNQLRIAETEKYAHVTFFFDGGVDKEIEGATRVLVNSPKVATYDLQPEMSAYEVKDKLIAELDKDIHDVVIVNFANCDMVGHTGVIPAAIKAVSVVDECIGEVYEKVLELGGTMLITADHGNAEEELDADGNPFTAHTTNVVPLIVTNSHVGLKEGGKLGDLVPTMLQLLGLPIPEEMDGESLLK